MKLDTGIIPILVALGIVTSFLYVMQHRKRAHNAGVVSSAFAGRRLKAAAKLWAIGVEKEQTKRRENAGASWKFPATRTRAKSVDSNHPCTAKAASRPPGFFRLISLVTLRYIDACIGMQWLANALPPPLPPVTIKV